MKYSENRFGAKIPIKYTRSYDRFYVEILQSDMLITLMTISSEFIEDNKDEVRSRIVEIGKDDKSDYSDKLRELLGTPSGEALIDFDFYQDFYGQMCFARIVDNMLSYFKEILAEVILTKPQVLKSKDNVRLDFLLDFDNINDLRAALAEKKVEELFYAGFDSIGKYFHDRLGINIFKSDEQEVTIIQAIKYRHLIVHNRGVVTRDFLRTFPETGANEGEYLKIGYKDISEMHLEINNFVAELDVEIADKFELEVYNRN